MDTRKFQYYSDEAKIAVNVGERLGVYAKAFAIFLDYVEKNAPEICDAYRVALQERLGELVSKPGVDLSSIPGLSEKVQPDDELRTLYIGYCAQLLELPEEIAPETVELLWSGYLKSSLYPFYYRAVTLCEIMGRDEAIEFLKVYIDTATYDQIQPDLELQDLDHFWNRDLGDSPYPGNGIEFRFSKGKQGGKVTRCMGHEVLAPFDDPELANLVACYGDKAQIEAQNPNFVFTRGTTLALGGPYCDTCLHDKRHVAAIEHPGPEFFENLG